VLLVGSGHSAATTLLFLLRLAAEEPGTSVVWSYRRDSPSPLEEIAADPLPGRLALAREANLLAREGREGLESLPGTVVDSISRSGSQLRVRLRHSGGGHCGIEVDRIIANTGFRPDLGLTRELQAHHCYASEGPMRLAAKLLGAGNDCLKMPSLGPDAQRHPEPDFFTAGQKSYGRMTSYLLANGRQGLRDVFRLVTGNAELDLDAEAR